MQRSNKSDLLKTIEHQQEQLQRYEKRLRDVVQAYKGLQTEKAALQASVAALSAGTASNSDTHSSCTGSSNSNNTSSKQSPPQHHCSTVESTDGSKKQLDLDADAEKSGTEASEKSYNAQSEVVASSDNDRSDAKSNEGQEAREAREDGGSQSERGGASSTTALQQQITTVTTTLNTVLQEKSKMEAMFQADKKKLRQEHEEIVKQMTEANDQQQEKLEKMEADIAEWKSRVRTSQFDREREQTDHALMLRELQKMLADERIAKEQLEQQLDESERARETRAHSRDVSEQYEKRIHTLSNELQILRERLKVSEEKANQPSPMLLDLQQQLAEVSAHHRLAVHDEQMRANEAEHELSVTAAQSELRVSQLEANLSELSEVVGKYERLRQQDQAAIQKLRDRVTQLDLENTALTNAAHTQPNNDCNKCSKGGEGCNEQLTDEREGEGEEREMSEEGLAKLIQQYKNIRAQITTVNDRADKPRVNMADLLQLDDDISLEDSTAYKKLKADHEKLKEEFERYKLRAQSVLKCKKENLVNKEEEQLKAKVSDLQERLRHVHRESDERDRLATDRIQQLHNSIAKLEKASEHKLKLQQQQHQNKMAELEAEIKRHRERTISLLAEKDHELHLLRSSSLPDRYEAHYGSSRQRYMSESSDSEITSPTGAALGPTSPSLALGLHATSPTANTGETVAQQLTKSSLAHSFTGETSLLHFAEEQARKDIELSTLRKQKSGIESALRDLQHAQALKEVKYHNEIERLEEQLHRMERNQSRESANLEYLKNVVYKYMVCSDVEGKNRMLNAISTILEFSPREKKEILNLLKSGWWK